MNQSRINVLKWVSFSIATLLALFTIFIVPRLHKKIPDIPGNALHSKLSKITECIQCHSDTGSNPLPRSHAAREQCLYCHKI